MPMPSGLTIDRIRAKLATVDFQVCGAFWLFGLINNVLYVIILSASTRLHLPHTAHVTTRIDTFAQAALDLVGPKVPKGIVLLADVVPSFFAKLTAPYYIDVVPYRSRIFLLVALSMSGMLLVALSPADREARTIVIKLCGVMLASLSSGLGELSFLGLTHYYGQYALAAWGSGTGGAGLVGAWAYILATTTLGLSVRTSLVTFSFLPMVMIASFFALLPLEPLSCHVTVYGSLPQVDNDSIAAEDETSTLVEQETLLASLQHTSQSFSPKRQPEPWLQKFQANLRRTGRLFFPYMLPLLLVYIAEYTINQGVAPTLLFPLDQTPFSEYREFYPTYNAIYQVGVFISRSSVAFIRVHHLYLPSLLQCVNLIILTAHAIFNFIPTVYIIFAIVFWEGLLGGLVYVSTFAEITDNIPQEDREFSLGATTVSDSAGICVAGLLGMAMEMLLCNHQVQRGRDYCKRL